MIPQAPVLNGDKKKAFIFLPWECFTFCFLLNLQLRWYFWIFYTNRRRFAFQGHPYKDSLSSPCRAQEIRKVMCGLGCILSFEKWTEMSEQVTLALLPFIDVSHIFMNVLLRSLLRKSSSLFCLLDYILLKWCPKFDNYNVYHNNCESSLMHPFHCFFSARMKKNSG